MFHHEQHTHTQLSKTGSTCNIKGKLLSLQHLYVSAAVKLWYQGKGLTENHWESSSGVKRNVMYLMKQPHLWLEKGGGWMGFILKQRLQAKDSFRLKSLVAVRSRLNEKTFFTADLVLSWYVLRITKLRLCSFQWAITVWEWTCMHNTTTLTPKQLKGIQPSFILSFIPVLFLTWHVKMSREKKKAFMKSGYLVLWNFVSAQSSIMNR